MWKRGDIILTSKPYSSLLVKSYRDKLCSFCFQELKGTRRKCFRDGCVYDGYYCSQNCLASDIQHQLECEILSEVGQPPPGVPYFILRTWLLQNQDSKENDPHSERVPGRKLKRQFADFLHHEDDMRKDKKTMKNIISHYRALDDYFPEDNRPDFKEFLQLYGRIVINDFEIFSEDGESYAFGIFLAPSIVDHSCEANAMVVFQGRQLTMRALENIPEKNMDLVKISYIDSSIDCSVERRRKLLENYYFRCNCCRCAFHGK